MDEIYYIFDINMTTIPDQQGMAAQLAPAYTGLRFLMTFNQLAIEKAKHLPQMMHMNIESINIKPEMTLFNNYKFNFAHVCRAFIKKY